MGVPGRVGGLPSIYIGYNAQSRQVATAARHFLVVSCS